MRLNKLTTAIRITSSALVIGLATQASAFEVQVGDATAKIYGYARLNASYDIDEDISISRGTRSGDFSLINTGEAEENEVTGHFGADAFQSRIGVKTTLPQGVAITVEGDFRSISGSPGNLRLRHAYGEYKEFLLGRTWSNFNSFVANTPVLEFDGIAGNTGLQSRVSQVRYTTGPLSVSVEDPTTRVFGTDNVKNSLPTLTARYEVVSQYISFSTAALVQEVTFDDGIIDDTAMGYAVFGAMKIAVTDGFAIQAALNYTDGGNAYLWRSGSNYYGEDAYVNGTDIETIVGYGGTIGASLEVGPGSVNLGIGMTELDWDDAEADGLDVGEKHKRNANALLNYQWIPVTDVTVGVQYGHFRVKKVNGDDGDANRLMFAAQYTF